MSQKSMGNIIKTRRTELGMTQADLGDLLHVSDKAVSKWECGHAYPDIMKLHDLANALNTSICILLGEEEVLPEKASRSSKEIDSLLEVSRSSVLVREKKFLKISLAMLLVCAALSIKIFFLVQDSAPTEYTLSFQGEVIGKDERGLTIKKVISSGITYGVENRVLSKENYRILYLDNVRIDDQSKQTEHLSDIPLNQEITVWFQSNSQDPMDTGRQIYNVSSVSLD